MKNTPNIKISNKESEISQFKILKKKTEESFFLKKDMFETYRLIKEISSLNPFKKKILKNFVRNVLEFGRIDLVYFAENLLERSLDRSESMDLAKNFELFESPEITHILRNVSKKIPENEFKIFLKTVKQHIVDKGLITCEGYLERMGFPLSECDSLLSAHNFEILIFDKYRESNPL
jgi:hypothetical protein